MNNEETLEEYKNRMMNRHKTVVQPVDDVKLKAYWDSIEKVTGEYQKLNIADLRLVLTERSRQLGDFFVEDKDNHEYIELLLEYFSTYHRKGLLIRGDYGVGKTYPLVLLGGLRQTFKTGNMINCKEVKRMVDGYGMKAEEMERIFSRYMDKEILVLDEMNEDWKVNFMGTVLNPVELILLHRYDLYVTYGTKTIITTNLSVNDIEKHYGGRVKSRLKEMCFDIIITGKDRRK